MPRVLITGCGGFVGRTLVERMVADGHDVWGVDRIEASGVFAGTRYLVADLSDRDAVSGVIDDANPEWIVHLAAQASVRRSFDEPYETIITNTLPTLHLLNTLRDTGRKTRLLAIGSADEYGTISEDQLPVDEDAPVNPTSPYALAKSIQNQCCRGFASLYGVDVVITRSFNHTGGGQRDVFVLPSFARQVVEIKKGQHEPVIEVGNLDVKRDFTDVRDVCAAYVALLRDGNGGDTYNVCSGRSHRIRDLLDLLCDLAGVDVEVRIDPDRLRPADVPELRGNPDKIKRDTGWEPAIPIEDTLRSLLTFWEQELGNSIRSSGGSE